jgi:hypothetical protein
MRVLRSAGLVAAAGLISVLGVVASGPTAEAATSSAPSGCSAGDFCFWNNINYNDGPGRVSGDNTSFWAFPHSSCPNGTWANCISSVFNNGTSGMGVDVYDQTGYNGDHYCVPDNVGLPNLTEVDYTGTSLWMNDNIESNYWTWSC